MASDIVQRLRKGITDGSHLRWTVTPDHLEAADEIELLRIALLSQEREALGYLKAVGSLQAEIESNALRIAELEADVTRYQGLLDAAIDDYNNARNTALEEAAKLIDEKIIKDTSAGKTLSERQDGNRDGLHYAAAIRALKASDDLKEVDGEAERERRLVEARLAITDRMIDACIEANTHSKLWCDDPREWVREGLAAALASNRKSSAALKELGKGDRR